MQPDSTLQQIRIDPLPHCIYHAGAIAIRNDAGIVHAVQTSCTAIGVSRVDCRRIEAHTNLARAGLRRRQLAEAKDLLRRSLPVIPDCLHADAPKYAPMASAESAANPALSIAGPNPYGLLRSLLPPLRSGMRCGLHCRPRAAPATPLISARQCSPPARDHREASQNTWRIPTAAPNIEV
ncbi:hypothetical protein D3C81_881800 [compost metagenome]